MYIGCIGDNIMGEAVIEVKKAYKKLLTALKEINDPDCIVERTDIFTPRDYFVKKFFGVNRDYEEKNSSLDDF